MGMTLQLDFSFLVKGSSKKQLTDLLYKAALLRYTTKDNLNSINPKLGTSKKLASLISLGYLACKNSQVYIITDKTRTLLKENAYNIEMISTKITGEGREHDLKITSVILSEMSNSDFHTVFYPVFDEVIPDACLVYRRGDSYRIVFLEVEEAKENWKNYLMDKKSKYERLGGDFRTYEWWWKMWATRLGLPYPTADRFCFSVLCVGNINHEWKGWRFEYE